MMFLVMYTFSQVIAERLSEEEIGGLKELFRMLDADNSGTITLEELKEGLKRVGSELMESEIKDLMDAVRYIVCYCFRFQSSFFTCDASPNYKFDNWPSLILILHVTGGY